MSDDRPGAAVDVCVCTYRRPQLADTLRSLAAQLELQGVSVRVIVADNDASPSAEALALQTAAELGLNLVYLHAPAHNISVARNACLAAARAEWVAFLDDDETADPFWLSRLLETALRGRWDAVLGRVQAVYRPQASAWVRKGDFHSIPGPVRVRGEILTGYTCNVLIRRKAAGRQQFAVQYGRSGGEDVDFFYQLTDRGGRIGFTPDAVVCDPVPADRERFSWLLRRWYRSGQSHAAVRLLGRIHNPVERSQEIVIAASKALAYAVGALAVLPFGVQWRRKVLGLVMHAGVVSRLLGGRLVEIYGQGGVQAPSGAVARLPAAEARS